MKVGGLSILALCVAAAPCAVAHAQDADLTKLSLEDLLSTEVTSVAKKPQRVDEAAAAVFVISQEDIRRSGATAIPDVLRMVPGLEVAQLPGGDAAVTARGFNGMAANKLLVLVDGREIYSSALGGVFWDQIQLPLEEIQRIEVVRGPGATLWGANAVNGVINIVTKHSVDSLGLSASAEFASPDSDRFYARYGVQLGDAATVRAYIDKTEQFGHAGALVGALDDKYRGLQGGVRLDYQPTREDALTLQGDMQSGEDDLTAASAGVVAPFSLILGPLPVERTSSSDNILGRWTHTWDSQTGMALQVYWDRIGRHENLHGGVDEYDVDFSHHFNIGSRNAVVWGANYRSTSDTSAGPSYFFLDPSRKTESIVGGYVEDDFSVVPGRLNVSTGAKFEHDSLAGFEFQPSIRAIWHDPAGWSIWGAVSQAARTPSLFEQEISLVTPFVVVAPPTVQVKPEQLIAYEIGWRQSLRPGLSLDVTVFDQVYHDLISWGLTGFTPAQAPMFAYGNHGHGENRGVEAAVEAAITPTWTLKAAANLQDLAIAAGGLGALNSANGIDPGDSPRGQASLRSLWTPVDYVDIDVWYRHVARLRTEAIPAYDDLQVRIAVRPSPHYEITLVGKNLLAPRRSEILDIAESIPAFVDRRVMLRLAVRY